MMGEMCRGGRLDPPEARVEVEEEVEVEVEVGGEQPPSQGEEEID